MGKTAREITNPELITDLKKAYCDEWLAYYAYNFMAENVCGELYPQLQDMLEGLAKSEYEHAREISDMIVKLGDKAESDQMMLEDGANFPAPIIPEELEIEEVKKIIAESEANAIRIYNELALKTKDTDIAVYSLVAHILSEELTHEELFENLK